MARLFGESSSADSSYFERMLSAGKHRTMISWKSIDSMHPHRLPLRRHTFCFFTDLKGQNARTTRKVYSARCTEEAGVPIS